MRPIALLALLVLAPAAEAASAPSFEQLIAAPARELIPAIKRQAFDGRDEESLIALLSDQDPSVRAQAARALKPYAPNSSRAEAALLGVMDDSWQPESVRREAVKSLAWAARNQRTRERLAALARDGGQAASLRGIACKALWLMAGQDSRTAETLRGLLDDASEPEAVRAGAAWALFAATRDPRTQDALRERASDGSLSTPLSVRWEAVRSLYLAMGERRVGEAVRAVAEDGWAPLPLRQAAVLAHHAVNTRQDAHQWLLELSADQSRPQLRHAALQALTDGPTLELARFFHLAQLGRQSIDPLENE
jgi:hypothetical protein